MKRTASLFLALLILFLAAPNWRTAFANAQTDPSPVPPIKIPLPFEITGVVIDNDVFFAMEDAFFQADFMGEMKNITLNDTQTLTFNPAGDTDRLLPNLFVTMTDADPFKPDVEAVASTVGTLIMTMQFLQEQFPDAFLFNTKLESVYAEAGLSYLVAEPEIWLWPKSMSAVLLPVCFYENADRELVDGIYLLEVVSTMDGAMRYALYNDSQHVVDYMAHMEITTGSSPFQTVLALWSAQNSMPKSAHD